MSALVDRYRKQLADNDHKFPRIPTRELPKCRTCGMKFILTGGADGTQCGFCRSRS